MNKKIKFKAAASYLLSLCLVGPSMLNNFKANSQEIAIPKEVFLKKLDLNDLGTGEGEKTIKIVLGSLTEEVQYDDGKTTENDITLPIGSSIEWYVVGTDQKGTKVDPTSVVLYSSKPIIKEEDGLFNDLGITVTAGHYSGLGVATPGDLRGSDYTPNVAPTKIVASHYGLSKVRRRLKELLDGTMFKKGQLSLIQNSTITDYDSQNSLSYKLTDKLYAVSATDDPSGDANKQGASKEGASIIYAGQNNNLPIHNEYLGPKVWLRSARDRDENYMSTPLLSSKYAYDNSGVPATSAAMKVDIKNLQFVSNVSGAFSSSNVSNFAKIDTNSSNGMYLRLTGGQGNIFKTDNIVSYDSVPNNSKLVVLAYNGTDTYELSEGVSESGSIDLSTKGLPEGYSYEAWIEQAGSGDNEGLVFATALAAGIPEEPAEEPKEEVEIKEPAEEPNEEVIPVTGDSTPVHLISSLSVISLFGIVFVYLIESRKKVKNR